MKDRLYALVILDGLGIADNSPANAVELSGITNIKRLMSQYPHSLLEASGRAVGLPQGQIGNSEVGHLNLGAGRVVYQDITRIDKAIEDGDFFENPAFLGAIENAKAGKALHLIGLLSDGGVHSSLNHLFALLRLCKQRGLDRVFVHCQLDGRDVAPDSASDYIDRLQAFLQELGVGQIASVSGRFFLMDRDNRWERVERGYQCVVDGIGRYTENPAQMVRDGYKQGVFDEFVEPIVVTADNKPVGEINKSDSVIFFNFRSDRAREFTRAVTEPDFTQFERKKGYLQLYYVCLTQYDASFSNVEVAFAPKNIVNSFGEYIASLGYTQARVAETEKYAHVTFFFNGGVEKPNTNEQRVLVNSPKVATYDLQPKMSAHEVTERALECINAGQTDVLILNYANCDMVGHTGNIDATVQAVKTVDECLNTLVNAILDKGGACIICADHGNAETMRLEDGAVWTAHTTNKVPFILVDDKLKSASVNDGRLSDVIPTLLEMMGLQKPAEMDGVSLIKK